MPDATPAPPRCPTVDGYVRIKVPGHPLAHNGWVLEHRYVAWDHFGPFDPSLHVHHVNGDKLDNRPENLEVVTPSEHQQAHANQDRPYDLDAAVRLYREGTTTVELGRMFGVNPATFSRALRAAGVEMRRGWRRVTGPTEEQIRAAHASSKSAREVADKLNVSLTVARRMMRDHDLQSFPPGRPRIHEHPAESYERGWLKRSAA